jgi:ATP-binding cassette, subfamily G (WHITE), eye pigment precursor transporter
VFFLPIYFFIGIGHGVRTYVVLQLVLMLLNFAAVGLGYMVSCIARRVEIAPIVGIITLLPFMLFGALFLNSADAPAYFIWIQYVSPIKCGFEGFMKIFWNKIESLPCDVGKPCLATSGKAVLEYYSID